MENKKDLKIETEKEALTTPKASKTKKAKVIKNQALFKRGGYAIAITAAVLVVIVVLNVLMSVLAKRVTLEFDMTFDKKNSISEENIEYIKGVNKEVTVSVCAKEEDYLNYLANYAPQLYGVVDDYTEYYSQTLTLINKYDNYNDKIKVKYLDTQDASFTEVTTKYSQEELNFGDIIVTCNDGKNERYKIVRFEDTYELEADETYAAMGYESYAVTGNNIETALTSAIAYVTNAVDKKVAFITGHSSTDFTESYQQLLKNNNYEIDIISDKVVNAISSKYDAIFIVAPSIDFVASELDIISKFLDNDGKYGKGLVFFADASVPYLTNLYAFLSQWGIEIQEGIMFETNSDNHIPDQPTVLGSYPIADNEILNNISVCVTGYNVPITQGFEDKGAITTTQLVSTPESVVAAPIGTANNWTGADKYKQQSFATVMQSRRFDYDENNDEIESYVFAFSSIEFIAGTYSETASFSNKNIAFKVAERAIGTENTGISFISKTITNQSYDGAVTEGSRNAMIIIFVIAIPLCIVVAGIYVYIRRKNA